MKRTLLLIALGMVCLASNAWAMAIADFNRELYSAQQGDIAAMHEVGKAFFNGYYRGHNIAQDYGQAYHWLREADAAAHRNNGASDPQVLMMVGQCFENGWGTGRSLTDAQYWYQRAVEMGYGPANAALNRVNSEMNGGYASGGGDLGGVVAGPHTVEPSYHHDPRVDRLIRAAEGGQPDAQYQLGMAYLNGEHGLPHDDGTAFHWVHESAEQGYGRAERELSNMYMQGIGTRHSRREAMEWDHRARRQGF